MGRLWAGQSVRSAWRWPNWSAMFPQEAGPTSFCAKPTAGCGRFCGAGPSFGSSAPERLPRWLPTSGGLVRANGHGARLVDRAGAHGAAAQRSGDRFDRHCCGGINVAGTLWGGRVQNVMTTIKVGFVVFLAHAPLARAARQRRVGSALARADRSESAACGSAWRWPRSCGPTTAGAT